MWATVAFARHIPGSRRARRSAVSRKLAERVVAWRWYIIAGWVVLAAVLLVVAGAVTHQLHLVGLRPPHVVPVDAGPDGGPERVPFRGLRLGHHRRGRHRQLGPDGGRPAEGRCAGHGLTTARTSKPWALGQHLAAPPGEERDEPADPGEHAGTPGEYGPNAAGQSAASGHRRLFLSGSGLGPAHRERCHLGRPSHRVQPGRKIISIATVLLILLLLPLVFRSVFIAFLPLLVVGLVHQMAESLTACFASGSDSPWQRSSRRC